jgi:hypothetical protein
MMSPKLLNSIKHLSYAFFMGCLLSPHSVQALTLREESPLTPVVFFNVLARENDSLGMVKVTRVSNTGGGQVLDLKKQAVFKGLKNFPEAFQLRIPESAVYRWYAGDYLLIPMSNTARRSVQLENIVTENTLSHQFFIGLLGERLPEVYTWEKLLPVLNMVLRLRQEETSKVMGFYRQLGTQEAKEQLQLTLEYRIKERLGLPTP